jgi:tRNA(Ile2) C34 agmatinyltransferase TiaS
VIIYLAPTLLVLTLLALAGRLRHHIEPACPACSSRTWHGGSGGMACASCGWTTGPAIAVDASRQLA